MEELKSIYKSMEKVYSKVNNQLLHFIKRKQSINQERENLVDTDNFIQCSAMILPKGEKFRPHHHIKRSVKHKQYIPQESWVIIQGSVKCFFYDIDDNLLTTCILYPGDASFTLDGGHSYLILEDDTIVYEYKTGPYLGIKFDKIFIDE